MFHTNGGRCMTSCLTSWLRPRKLLRQLALQGELSEPEKLYRKRFALAVWLDVEKRLGKPYEIPWKTWPRWLDILTAGHIWGSGASPLLKWACCFLTKGGPAWRHTAGWIDQHTVDDQCMTWALAAGVIHGFFVDIDRMRVFSAALSIQRCIIMHSEQCWWNITYIIHA
jgi:hypothetical protein